MKKVYALWFGSFAVVATSLYFYFQVPVIPMIIGGALALGIMVLVDRLKKK